MAEYQILPITQSLAASILTWSYDPPYDVYDLHPDNLSGLLNPSYYYHTVTDPEEGLVGYCCFGEDARVPGGDYSRVEPDVLDLGVGMRPDLTGQGLGGIFVGAILKYAIQTYQPLLLRVTVADFNQRSFNTFKGHGFVEQGRFIGKLVALPFTQLARQSLP